MAYSAFEWLLPQPPRGRGPHGNRRRDAPGARRLDLHDTPRCIGVAGLHCEELFPSALVPVCTPALAAGLHQPSDLRRAPLIFVPHLSDDWRYWFEAAGLRAPVNPGAEVFFDNNAMAMQAVLDGVGIAAAQTLYVTGALEAGRLVAPFPIVATKREAWYLEYRPSRADDPALIAFRDWLHGEVDRQRRVEAELIKRPI